MIIIQNSDYMVEYFVDDTVFSYDKTGFLGKYPEQFLLPQDKERLPYLWEAHYEKEI